MTNIAENQNKDKNINKLKAQRQAYSEVKFLMIISLVRLKKIKGPHQKSAWFLYPLWKQSLGRW